MKKTDDDMTLVQVPAALLTRVCLLLGKIPAEHAGEIYVELLACKPTKEPA